MIHTLQTSMTLRLPRAEVFEFFSNPGNLGRITPSEMKFRILTPGNIEMRQGAEVEYAIRVAGIPMRWKSLISRWNPPHEFVDEQLAGPYRQWIHTHRFSEHGKSTVIEDEVQYELPLQPLGELGHWFVKRQLDKIFRFRQQAIEQALALRP